MVVEGDELYTKVNKNVPQEDSEGWTVMLMERASRFILDLTCGKKDKDLFMGAIIPGIILVAAYAGYVILRSYLSPHLVPNEQAKLLKNKWKM